METGTKRKTEPGFGLRPLPIGMLDPAVESPSGHTAHLVSGMVTFYRDSVKHKNFKVESAAPVPFAEAYPTFASFTRPGQAYWYFYWRGKVLEGEYPETDYGYIRLLIFELMNYGLIPDPNRSVAHLIRLYEAYRDRYPELNLEVPEWIGDLFTEGGQHGPAAQWYASSLSPVGEVFLLERWNVPEQVSWIPFSFWKKWMGEVPGLEDLERSQLMRFAFGEALRIANDFFHETAGRTLIDHWLPIVARESRYLFRSAVVSPRRARQTLIVPRRGPSSSAVREWEAILEYVARLLSGDHLKGRRIHVDESRIPPGLRDRLKQRFAKVLSGNRPVPTETIPRKPSVKETDSRHGPNITRTLDTPEHPDMTRSPLRREIFDTPPEQVKEYRKTPSELTQRKEPPPQKGTSVEKTEQLPRVDQELYSFLNKLRSVELDFLRLFAQGPVSAVECRKIFRKKGFLPYLLVDKINEKALETLGDVLVFEEEGHYSLDEEWGPQILRAIRDEPAGDQQTAVKDGQSDEGEAEELLSPPSQTDEPADKVVEEMATSADEWNREEEQEEASVTISSPEATGESPQTIPDWKTEPVEVANIRIFLADLTPEEREFFTLFRQRKVVPYEDCAAFARARGLMLTSFIDGINETAMEFTGEIVLEEVDGNVVLTEEFTGLITLLEEETEG